MNHQVVLITGAASGIGRAVALASLKQGNIVAGLDRNDAGLKTLADEAGVPAERVLPYICDVADSGQVANVLRAASATAGVPTAVFANAGIELNAPIDQLDDTTWNQVIDVNLNGVFHVLRESIARLIEAKLPGSIVCTSSPSAFVAHAGGNNAAYAASKGGISALVRAAALDAAPYGIRVNAVVPGATRTGLLPLDADAAFRTEIETAALTQVPLGRVAEASEIAEAVTWLLSVKSSYVTGSNLVVDGGLLARSSNTF